MTLPVSGVEAPSVDASTETLNATLCCKNRGVSEGCMPVCEPRSLNASIVNNPDSPSAYDQIYACVTDIESLIFCGSGLWLITVYVF